MSHDLLFLYDTTEHHALEVIVLVWVISFLNIISYNELCSCWNFEKIYIVHTRIAHWKFRCLL